MILRAFSSAYWLFWYSFYEISFLVFYQLFLKLGSLSSYWFLGVLDIFWKIIISCIDTLQIYSYTLAFSFSYWYLLVNRNCYFNVANIISLSFIELDIFCSLFKKIFVSPKYLKNIFKILLRIFLKFQYLKEIL